MPIEIVLPSGKDCFDYEAKYNDESDGGAQLRCPAHLTAQERQNIENITRTVHEALGLRHYSRSDFIMTPQGIYFLEVNTLPGLTKHSLIPHALEEAGCNFSEFTDHLINLAVAKN